MRCEVNKAWTAALALFVAHNLEEAVAIASDWPARHFPKLAWTTGKWPLFAAIAIMLTAAIALLAYYLRNESSASALCLRVFLVLMLLNAAWHIGVSVYVRAASPGVLTGSFLIVPLYSYLLWCLHPRGA